MSKKQDQVKVRLLPLHNIGGVGYAGDVVWMSEEDAEKYFDEGFVELVDEDEELTEVASSAGSSEPKEESFLGRVLRFGRTEPKEEVSKGSEGSKEPEGSEGSKELEGSEGSKEPEDHEIFPPENRRD